MGALIGHRLMFSQCKLLLRTFYFSSNAERDEATESSQNLSKDIVIALRYRCVLNFEEFRRKNRFIHTINAHMDRLATSHKGHPCVFHKFFLFNFHRNNFLYCFSRATSVSLRIYAQTSLAAFNKCTLAATVA